MEWKRFTGPLDEIVHFDAAVIVKRVLGDEASELEVAAFNSSI